MTVWNERNFTTRRRLTGLGSDLTVCRRVRRVWGRSTLLLGAVRALRRL